MFKKIVLWVCSFMLALSLVSCGINQVLELDKNSQYLIEEVREEEALEGIYYQDQMYYIDRWNLFAVIDDSYNINEGDELLSWNGTRFGYKKVFYSYTKDDPLFIYETAYDDVFFKESYDYTFDTFIIVGTDSEILFSDIISDLSTQTDVNFQEDIEVQLYSKTNSRIGMKFYLGCIENQWYIRSAQSGSSSAWAVSDVFLQLLSENDMI